MGKWETNIGNAIKNNSGGRVVIEENGVRHNKKVSVVRQVVGGVVKQVWNSFVLPTFDLAIKWNSGQTDLLIPASYTDSMGNVITVEMPRHVIGSDRCDFSYALIRIQLSQAQVNDLISNGYNKAVCTLRVEHIQGYESSAFGSVTLKINNTAVISRTEYNGEIYEGGTYSLHSGDTVIAEAKAGDSGDDNFFSKSVWADTLVGVNLSFSQ